MYDAGPSSITSFCTPLFSRHHTISRTYYIPSFPLEILLLLSLKNSTYPSRLKRNIIFPTKLLLSRILQYIVCTSIILTFFWNSLSISSLKTRFILCLVQCFTQLAFNNVEKLHHY